MSRRFTARAGWGVALLVLTVLGAVVALALAGLADHSATDQERATAIASGLRCPVCTDLSAADSSAPLARQMRVEILEQVRGGESDDQIRAGFVASYGPGVLLSPPSHGWGRVAHLLPWLVTAAALLGGLTVVLRGRRREERGDQPRTDRPRPDQSLQDNRLLVDRALSELLKEER